MAHQRQAQTRAATQEIISYLINADELCATSSRFVANVATHRLMRTMRNLQRSTHEQPRRCEER